LKLLDIKRRPWERKIKSNVLSAKEKTVISIENSQAGSAGSTPVARSKLPTQIQVLTLGGTLKGLFARGQ